MSQQETPAKSHDAAKRAAPREQFPVDEAKAATERLLQLLLRAGGLCADARALASVIEPLRLQLHRASLPEDFRALFLQLAELRLQLPLLADGSSEVQTSWLREWVEAIIPVARTAEAEAAVMGLRRLQDALASSGELRNLQREFHAQMEVVAEHVQRLLGMSGSLRQAVLQLIASVGRLAEGEPVSRFRLEKLRDRIVAAGDYDELEQLRRALLSEADALISEVREREQRAWVLARDARHVEVELSEHDAEQLGRAPAKIDLADREVLHAALERLARSPEPVVVAAFSTAEPAGASAPTQTGVLSALVEAVRTQLSPVDTLAELSPGVVVALLPGRRRAQVVKCASRALERFRSSAPQASSHLSASAGVTTWKAGMGFAEVSGLVESALQQAEGAGGNHVAVA